MSAHLSWELVSTFLVLAEEMRFGVAARRLGISRQTLSRRVGRLEVEVGTALVSHTTRRVELTRAGTALREQAIPIAEAMRRLAQQVRVERPGTPLTIGISTDLHAAWGRRVGEWVSRRGTHAVLEGRAPVEAMQSLRDGNLDLVLFAGELPDVPSATVGHEPMVAIFPATHRAASQRSIRAGDLADLPVAVTDAGELEHHRAAVGFLHGNANLPYVLAPRVGTIARGLLRTVITRGAAALVLGRSLDGADTTGLAVLPMEPAHSVPVTLIARPGLPAVPEDPFHSLAAHLLLAGATDS